MTQMQCQYEMVPNIPGPTNKPLPFIYPAAHEDIPNSSYAPEVTGNIINKIYHATKDELLSQYPAESVYPFPALIVSADPRRTEHNSGIYNYNIAHGSIIYNNDPACSEPFAVRNLNDATSLQTGYARNIDLDSELRRINHLNDKCWYDNYKFHPMEAPVGNGLYCNRKELVKDYTPMGKPNCLPSQMQKSAITPAQIQPISQPPKYYSDNGVKYGNYKNPSAPNEKNINASDCVSQVHKLPKCLPEWVRFPACQDKLSDDAQCLLNYKINVAGNIPQHYKFTGETDNTLTQLHGGSVAQSNYSSPFDVGIELLNQQNTMDVNSQKPIQHNGNSRGEYPCQRLFNNSTKRSTLPNFHNTFDINPKYLL